MNTLPNDIDKIIARILSNEAEIDDILVFNTWLNNREENWQEFLLLKSYWETDSYTTEPALYPEMMYEQHIQRVINKGKGKPGKMFTKGFILSIAASFLILLGLSTFLFFNKENDPPIEYYTYLNSNGISEVDLPDGTRVRLNQDSKLIYTNHFGKKERYVKLEGEAYFDVTKNPEQIFKVDMGYSTIEVLGTKFNAESYTNKKDIVTTLEEGSILFCTENQKITLTPSQQLIFSKETGMIDVKQVETELFTAWKDQLYRYHSITVEDLSKELEKIYGVEFIVPARLKDITVSGSFIYNQPINEVLKIMQKSLAFSWKKEGKKIIIK